MAHPFVDGVLIEARSIVADRRRRLRGAETVTADGRECDPCDDGAGRFCAIRALIRAAHTITGEPEQAHQLGWKVAGLVAKAAKLPRVDEDEPGWSLAMLSSTEEAFKLARSYAADQMRIVQSGSERRDLLTAA